MIKIRTDKDILTTDDIKKYIAIHERDYVPTFAKLWKYYEGKNPTILDKQVPDPNNPDNRTPVPYARKIITTYTGYAYRPRYISYKSENEAYLKELQLCFDENNEHIKTSTHGRNSGIFGISYELLYMGMSARTGKPEVRFAVIDPREIVLLYDQSIDPVRKIAIRYYKVDEKNYKIDVYYADRTEHYTATGDSYNGVDKITFSETERTYFGEVPVIPFYAGNEGQSIIEPILPLVDDYDALISGGIVEFDRFANAYLKLVKMSLNAKDQQNLKRSRIFEQLQDQNAVTFLTKDIPTDYIRFMTELIRDQIHVQSHVPDLGSGAFKDGLSGVAVDRLMFDFENVVSNAEAEFDTALIERIRLITNIFTMSKRAAGTFTDITIAHKRNKPTNQAEAATVALQMTNAGFSRYAVADNMPDEMIPDTEAELERQEEDKEGAMPDVEKLLEERDAAKTGEEKRGQEYPNDDRGRETEEASGSV